MSDQYFEIIAGHVLYRSLYGRNLPGALPEQVHICSSVGTVCDGLFGSRTESRNLSLPQECEEYHDNIFGMVDGRATSCCLRAVFVESSVHFAEPKPDLVEGCAKLVEPAQT